MKRIPNGQAGWQALGLPGAPEGNQPMGLRWKVDAWVVRLADGRATCVAEQGLRVPTNQQACNK